jgi:hypothetical protein
MKQHPCGKYSVNKSFQFMSFVKLFLKSSMFMYCLRDE